MLDISTFLRFCCMSSSVIILQKQDVVDQRVVRITDISL